MKKNFQETEPGKISDNVFNLIGSDWMLITAGCLHAGDYQ